MLPIESRSSRRVALPHRPSRPQRLAVALGAVLAATLASGSMAADSEEQALLQRLKKLYPSSGFTAVNKSPLPGLFEVNMGSHVAYVGKDGRYFMLGRLFDLQNQVDLTAARQAGTVKTALNEEQGPKIQAGQRIDPAELPLRNAIVQVNGTGARKLFVFLDPKCPGCDQLDADLSQLPDTTVYTFLAPALDPDSRDAARKQWIVFMPERALETQVIDHNLQVARRLGLAGMPALIRSDGEVVSGPLPLPLLSAWLDAGTKVAQAAMQQP